MLDTAFLFNLEEHHGVIKGGKKEFTNFYIKEHSYGAFRQIILLLAELKLLDMLSWYHFLV